MRIVARVLGFFIGVGLGIVGLLIWSISNDGVGDETTMKFVGGVLILIGVVLVIAAMLSRGTRVSSDSLEES